MRASKKRRSSSSCSLSKATVSTNGADPVHEVHGLTLLQAEEGLDVPAAEEGVEAMINLQGLTRGADIGDFYRGCVQPVPGCGPAARSGAGKGRAVRGFGPILPVPDSEGQFDDFRQFGRARRMVRE